MIDKIENKSFEDLAFGCILGCFVGDSCGSYNEFNGNRLSESDSDEVMKMPGGGPFELESGQITDDGEMAIALMLGLINGKSTLDLNQIV